MKNSAVMAAIVLLVVSSCNNQTKNQEPGADNTTKATKEKSDGISTSANEDDILTIARFYSHL